ncbi:ShlB/FhaC/HecB family hemolysin secretion/activation protein [Burkholderia sp. BE17]|uniref:ShlB/FhaC/HecB family hemolysin secretion/activation protein n=1 Tax=Burkholderia sp. BE17 TaxID=2656644 RepID=UPI00128E0E30|nr:ShlB/FhaC/HecB family hemolysin secretion/activation protein [Burkholderia sp. BE17]MPV68648.1 hypothetical protein [Burkholderia sp. BE17]
MKTVKTRIAMTVERWQPSMNGVARGRRYVEKFVVPALALSCGIGLSARVSAEELSSALPHDEQLLRELVEMHDRGPRDSELLQRAIDLIQRDQNEIQRLRNEVAALRGKSSDTGSAIPIGSTRESEPAHPATATSRNADVAGVRSGGPDSAAVNAPGRSSEKTQLGMAPPARSATHGNPTAGDISGTVGSITLAARDITRAQPESAPTDDRATNACGARPVALQGPTPLAPTFPALGDQAAADAYRAALARAGEVSAEPGLPTTDIEGLRAKLAQFVGQPVDLELVKKISRTATEYVAAHTDNLVNVYVPPQKLRDGNLVVVLAPAKLGQVRTQGQKHISEHDLNCAIRLRPGDRVDLKKLTDDLAFLNTSPWRQVSSSFTPGTEAGEADLVLQTVDRYPLRVYGSWDNTGTPLSGLNRWRTGLNWGDAFGIVGSRLDYSVAMGNTPKRLLDHTLLFTKPTSYRDTLTFTGNYSSSDVPIEDGLFHSKGHNVQLGAQWTHVLGGPAVPGSEVTAGFEYKRVGNELLFNGSSQTSSAPKLYQFYAGAQVPWIDRLGSNSLNFRFTFAPGYNSDADFNAARAGAESDYRRVNLTYDRYINLPAGFSLHGRFNGQWANGPIIASEQLQISGAAAVRGYREDVLLADSGYVVNIEALTPAIALPIPYTSSAGQLQGVLFYDFGHAFERGEPQQNVALNEIGRKFNIASAGFGARFNINQNVSLKADVGWRLRGPASLPSYVVHGSLVVAY